jgi:hypothetical protein
VKLIHLLEPGTGKFSLDVARQVAAELARYAVNNDYKNGRVTGDPVHEEVTEGRRKSWEDARVKGAEWARAGVYSSCGDLGHWTYYRLGCRSTWINRREHMGWRAQSNIWKFVTSPAYVQALKGTPEIGDLLHVANLSVPNSDHVCILVGKKLAVIDGKEVEIWTTADYGQPHGLLKDCQVSHANGFIIIRGRTFKGFVDLSKVELSDSAIVPDHFDFGVPDDNPYRD